MQVTLNRVPDRDYICAVGRMDEGEISDFVTILERLDTGIYDPKENNGPEDILERIRHTVVCPSSVWVPKSTDRGDTPENKLTSYEQERVGIVRWIVLNAIRGNKDVPFPKLHIAAEHRMDALAKAMMPYAPTEEEKREAEISGYIDRIEKLEAENKVLKNLISERTGD